MPVIETSELAPPDRESAAADWLLSHHQANTEAAYRRDIDGWFAWCDSHGVGVFKVSRRDVDLYLAALARRELSNATQCRMVSAVSSFYSYVRESREDIANPAARVKRPQVGETSMTPYLDGAELSRLLAVADTVSPRDAALVRLLAYTGVRVAEMCGASTSDLRTEMGELTLTVRRKGGRQDLVTIARPAAGALRRHLGDRKGPLFEDDHGLRMRPHQVTYRLKVLCSQAGVKRVSPHGLRHTAATLLLRQTSDPQAIQRVLGHRRVTTTMRYLRPVGDLEGSPVHALAQLLEGRQ